MFPHCWFSYSKQVQEEERKICQAKQTLWNTLEPRGERIHRGITVFFRVRQYNPFKNPLPQTPQLSINSRWEAWSDPDESPLSLLPPPGCRIENCESCFSKDFCTKCKSGFYLHKGRCFDKCPEGFAPLEDTMECGGTYHNTDMYNKFQKLFTPAFDSLYKVFKKFSGDLLIV